MITFVNAVFFFYFGALMVSIMIAIMSSIVAISLPCHMLFDVGHCRCVNRPKENECIISLFSAAARQVGLSLPVSTAVFARSDIWWDRSFHRGWKIIMPFLPPPLPNYRQNVV